MPIKARSFLAIRKRWALGPALPRRLPTSIDEPLPKHPLLLPVRQDRNGTHLAFEEAGDVFGGGFKVEDRTE